MKTAQELYETMRARVAAQCGFDMDDSCDLAVRLYAAAAELESLYAYADWSRRQCFPQSAVGEYLDRHALMHGISRTAAEYATGILSLRLEQTLSFHLTVPEGTCFCVPDGPMYRLTQDCVIPAGVSQAGAEAVCTVAGVQGNAAIGEICGLVDAPAYIVSVTNEAAFTGGREAETDEHLRGRILDACRRRPNGANTAYYEAVALEQPGVTSAVAMANYPVNGQVGLCVSVDYGVPTTAQLNTVRAALAERTELGVNLQLIAPTVEAVNVAVSLWPVEGVAASEAIAAVRAVITAYFERPMLRRSIYRSALGNLIYQTGLVKNYAFTQPADDRTGLMTLFTLGTLTVTEGA